MRRLLSVRKGICLLLSLALVLGFCACSNRLHKVTYDKKNYTDTQTGAVYQSLPNCYEPRAKGEEYASLNLSGSKQTFYEVDGLDPLQWLTTQYNDLYCSTDITLPSFSKWNASELYFCTTTTLVVAELVLRDTDSTHAALIDAICEQINQGQEVHYSAVSPFTPTRTMSLRFVSPDVPGVYYTMLYLEYEEDAYDMLPDASGELAETNVGKYFVYDRPNGRCVAVNNVMHYLIENGVPTATPTPED